MLYMMVSASSLTAYVIYASLLMLFSGIVAVAIPTIPVKVLPSEVIGKATGIISTGGQLAGLIAPLAIGFIVDASGGQFFAAFMYMIIFSLVSMVSIFFIKYKKTEDMTTLDVVSN